MIDRPRTCPDCGELAVIPAGEDNFRVLICVNCFTRFDEDDGGVLHPVKTRDWTMTSIYGPRNDPQPPEDDSPPMKTIVKLWNRRSDHAGESAAQHYIDRMTYMAQFYDVSTSPPTFRPPVLWMLELGDPIPCGAPHNILKRARLADLLNPIPPSK